MACYSPTYSIPSVGPTDGGTYFVIVSGVCGTVTSSSATLTINPSPVVAAGAWHHVLASLQDPTVRLWVDGVRTETTVHPNTAPALDALRLGGNAANAYSGSLDEVGRCSTGGGVAGFGLSGFAIVILLERTLRGT